MPNLLWMISPPNVAPIAMLGRYQALFVAAEHLTKRLQSFGLVPEYLPQATDVAHFHPDRQLSNDEEMPLVFVGGYAPRVDRRIVIDAAKAGFEPQIWGPGWKGVVPDHLWRGERLNHDQLARVYAGARIVLNSHMANMAMLGFMSNRSYDALASGAMVLSDPVLGFSDPDFPELRQVSGLNELIPSLEGMLAAPRAERTVRLALHDRLTTRYGFEARAEVILARARALLVGGHVAAAAFQPGRSGPGRAPIKLPQAKEDIRISLMAAAQEIATTARHLEQASPPPLQVADGGQGLIHALSADLHDIRQIARTGALPADDARLEGIAARARRLIEVLADPPSPLSLRASPAEQDQLLARFLQNEPLWAHGPAGFHRNGGKKGLPLRPRKQPSVPTRPVGVFLHLYYDELAPVFAERLANIAVASSVYVSTDTQEKAAHIRAHLPEAEIRVFENRGRDIWPKLYGFADAYARHDLVLHLHGKRSLHSDKLDDWLAHILDCLLGSTGEVNRILSFFETIPGLGMVAPLTFRAVLGAAHWGANRDIARELVRQMALPVPLPDNNQLRFPVGSMFWARSAAIRPLLDLALRPEAFPPEAGQVDGTLAHAIERMLGVTCRATGFHLLSVMGADSQLHRKHQIPFSSNRELRETLATGAFDE